MNSPQTPAASVVLNQANAFLFNYYRKFMIRPTYWHKFTILNSRQIDCEKVLKAVVNGVHPHELFPTFHQVDEHSTYFLARNCSAAVEKLCGMNLVIQYNEEIFLIVTVELCVEKLNYLDFSIQDLVISVLKKRYHSSTKTLNLDNFSKDPDFQDKLYVSLSHPKHMTFVLHIVKSMTVQVLKLSNNEIKSLSSIEALWSCSSMTSLDLRNNLIENMITLSPLKNMHITELIIDGNPVCQNYEEIGYVRAVKELCPVIEKLDGVLLGVKGFPALRRNYLVNTDGQGFVDQFLEHFFTLYDSADRSCLTGFYHKKAMFSLTNSFLPGQTTSLTAMLKQYRNKSRNLKTMSDFSKSSSCLSVGSDEVIKTLCGLPQTEHDPYTFTVDLVYYTESTVTLVVTGVFREPVNNLKDTERFYGFTRTFILLSAPHNEFNIINEQLHVANATSIQVQKAFRIVKLANVDALKTSKFSISEKNCIVNAVSQITTLNKDWAKKCLEDSKWELKKALNEFVELYKDDKIPPDAFISDV